MLMSSVAFRRNSNDEDDDLDRDRRIVEHLFGMLEHEIEQHRRELRSNTDATMREAASAAQGIRWYCDPEDPLSGRLRQRGAYLAELKACGILSSSSEDPRKAQGLLGRGRLRC